MSAQQALICMDSTEAKRDVGQVSWRSSQGCDRLLGTSTPVRHLIGNVRILLGI